MKQCPKCGANCADSDTFCGICGTPLPISRQYPPRSSDGLAVASMVLGIIGVVFSLVFIGIVPAILAIIFGLIVLCSARRRQNGCGMAIAGLVTGGFALLIAALVSLFFISVVSSMVSSWTDNYDNAPGFSQSDDSHLTA
ncbi:MAG: DUF4190 domain-containing protein [Ethanoligenens sp.]|uniref:DUF4190 domain-containing protein n=1 Tax=Ethanoligenens sp. TaxID=2099655 RepID=UPI0039E7B8BF